MEKWKLVSAQTPLSRRVFGKTLASAAVAKKKGMAAKIKLALEGLENEAVKPQPFSTLSGAEAIRSRLGLAARALRVVAGEEDHTALLKELCGHNNKTAANIAAKYKTVPEKKERQGKGQNL